MVNKKNSSNHCHSTSKAHIVSELFFKRFLIIFLCLLFIFNVIILPNSSKGDLIQQLPYKEKITLPIDTALPEAIFQPIDIRIVFTKPCWAKNETYNSVRVFYELNGVKTEIESQMYNLDFIDESHIRACSVVFIVPEEANGLEEYYIAYDVKPIERAEYIDHISIEDSSYFYEPISGQKIDFDYYKIIEDGSVVYGIIQKGSLLGIGLSQSVVKMLPGAPAYDTNYAEQMASFSMYYGIDDDQERTGPGYAKTISKSVLIDGNLMVRIRIASEAPEGTVVSDNIYTYYYSPSLTKRIVININHTVLEDTKIGGTLEEDGMYAGMLSFKVRSSSFEKLNTGKVLPYLHVYGEDDIIRRYEFPQNPASSDHEWVLKTEDDIDIGSEAWISIDDSTTEESHGLIFQTNIGIFSGPEDGLQVKASGQQYVKVPGLEADVGQVIITRNAYEKGGKHNIVLPAGLSVKTTTEFVSVTSGGYDAIQKEATVFKQLTKLRPIENGTIISDTNNTFSLTVYAHNAWSFPAGAPLSAISARNISYIEAEIYKDGEFVSSGSIGRLALYEKVGFTLENLSFFEKINLLISLIDLRNLTFFKKIEFPELKEGIYLLKIYRINPFYNGKKEFIAFKNILIDQNKSTHINCRSPGFYYMSVIDQNNAPIQGAVACLKVENITIANATTNKNGFCFISAPFYIKTPYTLEVLYDGFLIKEQDIMLNRRQQGFKNKTVVFSIETKDVMITVKDLWGLPPDVDTNPFLTSSSMTEPINILPDSYDDGVYHFLKLNTAEYILTLSYKAFSIKKTIDLAESNSLVTFPAEYSIDIKALNKRGLNLAAGTINIERKNKIKSTSLSKNGVGSIRIPPGHYIISIENDGKMVLNQELTIVENRDLLLVADKSSIYHEIGQYSGIILLVVGIVLYLWRRQIFWTLELIAEGLLIYALFSSWWTLSGSTGGISTSSSLMLYPAKIITETKAGNLFGGEISQMPKEASLALFVMSVLLVVSIGIVLSCFILKKRNCKYPYIPSGVMMGILIAVNIGFLYVISIITQVGVGSIYGKGLIDISLQGVTDDVLVNVSWGLGTGFFAAVGALFVAILAFTLTIPEKWKDYLLEFIKKSD